MKDEVSIQYPIRIAIVEDNDDYRKTMELCLHSDSRFIMEGAFASAESFLQSSILDTLDVVPMDIHLLGISGIDCTKRLMSQYPQVAVIMLTSASQEAYIIDAFVAGAKGYLDKMVLPQDVYRVVLDVMQGGMQMSPHIARKVIERLQKMFGEPSSTDMISDREMEILQFVARGMKYKEIAQRLYVSEKTIRTHISNMYKKLGVHSKQEAIEKVFKDSGYKNNV